MALPPLGCGLGGLRWSDVRPLIEQALSELPLRVLVYEPQPAPAPERMPEARERPRMTPFRATLVWLLGRYLAPGETATPLEVQKLLYFLQEAGKPLRLRFVKQRYGPYADAARSNASKDTTSPASATAPVTLACACCPAPWRRRKPSWRITPRRASATSASPS